MSGGVEFIMNNTLSRVRFCLVLIIFCTVFASQALLLYIQDESLDKHKVPLDVSGWTTKIASSIPRQQNGYLEPAISFSKQLAT